MISEGTSAEKTGHKLTHLCPFAGHKCRLVPSLVPALVPFFFSLFSYVYVEKDTSRKKIEGQWKKSENSLKRPRIEILQRSRENGPACALFPTTAFWAAENRRCQ